MQAYFPLCYIGGFWKRFWKQKRQYFINNLYLCLFSCFSPSVLLFCYFFLSLLPLLLFLFLFLILFLLSLLFLFCLYFLYDFFFETIQKNRSFRQERGGWKADKIRGLRPFAYWHSQAVPSDAGVTQECNVLCLGLVKVLQLLRQVMWQVMQQNRYILIVIYWASIAIIICQIVANNCTHTTTNSVHKNFYASILQNNTSAINYTSNYE